MAATTIKSLSQSGLTSLPSSYVYNVNDRPIMDSSEDSFPIIDFTLLTSSNSEQRCKAIQDLGQACEQWGCFFLFNHGVPDSLINRIMEGSKGFLDLPDEEKREFKGSSHLDPMKYGSDMNSATEVKIWRDYFQVLTHPDFYFPPKPEGVSEIVFEYSKLIREIVRELLKGISESLGLEPNYINKAMNMESCFQVLAANLYPPCPEPEHALGLLPHSDHGLITVVAENIGGGLQTLHDGKWVNVNAPPNALIVNTGDCLEMVTNGRYKRNMHRSVLFSNATRISIVTADAPSLDQVIGPAPELVDEDHPLAFISIATKKLFEMQQSTPFHKETIIDRFRIPSPTINHE